MTELDIIDDLAQKIFESQNCEGVLTTSEKAGCLKLEVKTAKGQHMVIIPLTTIADDISEEDLTDMHINPAIVEIAHAVSRNA
jgi:hypothetical protein